MSRFGSTITESDTKILSGLFNPYQWYTPTPTRVPSFETRPSFFGSFGASSQDQTDQQQAVQQQVQKPQVQQLPQQQQLQQQFQQPQQQQQFQQPLQQYQQPIQQQASKISQSYQQQDVGQQFQQPIQSEVQQILPQQFQQPSDLAFQRGVATFIDQGPQVFQDIPAVIFEISDMEPMRERGYRKEHTRSKGGKRIPIVDQTELPHPVSLQQGNLSEWISEARNCIDKILQLNNKAYNRVHSLENFKFIEGGSNYQSDAESWSYRLRRNLDNLVKENEKLRAELDSGSFGKGSIQQGVQQGVNQFFGGVNMSTTGAVDTTNVIKPSEIRKVHSTSEKIGKWHPQEEKHTFTERVKDTAMGIANSVENVALHPIQSVENLASTVGHVALHPIQSVENAADAVIHTVM